MDETAMRTKADHAASISNALLAAAEEAGKYGDAGKVAADKLKEESMRFHEEDMAWQDAINLMEAAKRIRQIAAIPPGNPVYKTDAVQQTMAAAADRLDAQAAEIVDLYRDHLNQT